MPGESKNGMQCSEFDALLTEALDGTLAGAKLERFRAHATVCSVCGPLFAEVDAGRRLLLSLEEIEPPAHLMNSILAATSGFDTARLHTTAQRQLSLVDRLRAWVAPVFNPFFGVIRQPRFAMSFGMVFFSVTMALNVAGVKMTDLRHIDLRPSAISRGYHMTQGRVVKYYENIRFVYQIESKVREIKRATTPAEPVPSRDQRRRENNNTSGQPEQRQERNYSQGENTPVLAFAPDVPVVTVPAIRRIV
jgi:Putative zinc-finger